MNVYDGLAAATRATAVETTPTSERYARVRELAETQSRRLILDARRELLLVALRRMVHDCYDLDTRGRWLCLRDDGMVIIPAPWAAGGRRRWGMRQNDAELLRILLVHAARVNVKGAAPTPAFFYAADARRWFVALASYPTEAAALAWVDGWAARAWDRDTLEKATERLETSTPMGHKRATSRHEGKARTGHALG